MPTMPAQETVAMTAKRRRPTRTFIATLYLGAAPTVPRR